MTIFLRFPNEETFLSLSPKDDEGNFTLPNLDVIGLIYEGGEYDEEGNIVIPPSPIQGYHVNMMGDVPGSFRPYIIDRPALPIRIFAGL